jgi:hypothetical protein
LLEECWFCITARSLALIGDVNAGCAPAFLWNGKERAMSERRRFKQQLSLEDRRVVFAKTARAVAALLPPGAEKDEMLRKALQADTMAGLTMQPREATP